MFLTKKRKRNEFFLFVLGIEKRVIVVKKNIKIKIILVFYKFGQYLAPINLNFLE